MRQLAVTLMLVPVLFLTLAAGQTSEVLPIRTHLATFDAPADGALCALDPLNNVSLYPDIYDDSGTLVEPGNRLVVTQGDETFRWDVERVEGVEVLPLFISNGQPIVVDVEWYTWTSIESIGLTCEPPAATTTTAPTTSTIESPTTTAPATTVITTTSEPPADSSTTYTTVLVRDDECAADDTCDQLADTGASHVLAILGAFVLILVGVLARLAEFLD